MPFVKKDNVYLLAQKDTGEIHAPAENSEHYQVYEDLLDKIGVHHEKVIRALPFRETTHSEAFSLVAKAYAKDGYRFLSLAWYNGGTLRARGGRLGKIERKTKIRG